jgi:hypothetical protein
MRAEPVYGTRKRAFFRTLFSCIRARPCYYTRMDNTHDCTSDLPDNFDPSWNEPTEQEWEDIRDEAYMDEPYCHDDYSYDSAVWESAYGPAEDGGYPF